MIAGRLKYKLMMIQPVSDTDGFGAEGPTRWAERGVIRADRVSLAGSEKRAAGEFFAEYKSVWNVRAQHPVAEGWRVREYGTTDTPAGMLWLVTNVEPNRHKGYKTLICRRANL